jgi:hypothetical protein
MSTKIESKHVEINKSVQEVFDFVKDFNNIEQVLPKDKISDWKSDFDQCSFKIQNAAVIPLVKESVIEPNTINIVSGEKTPFPFTLKITFNALATDKTEVFLNFDGEINAFLKMMVVKPLNSLFNFMAAELKTVCEK